MTAEFSKVAKVSVERLLRLIREGGGRIKLDPHRPNVLVIKTGDHRPAREKRIHPPAPGQPLLS